MEEEEELQAMLPRRAQGDAAVDDTDVTIGTTFDSPFKPCVAYESTLQGFKADAKENPGLNSRITPVKVTHFPSVATYTIEGKASIDNFKDELDGTQIFTIKCFMI
jgi:hypothetical protein